MSPKKKVRKKLVKKTAVEKLLTIAKILIFVFILLLNIFSQ